MFRNYLAAALRNLMRNKAGVVHQHRRTGASAIAAALLIGLYLRYELYFDDSLPGERQVYRLSLTIERPDSPAEIWDTADPYMAEFLKLDYPEVAIVGAHRRQVGRVCDAATSRSRSSCSSPTRISSG